MQRSVQNRLLLVLVILHTVIALPLAVYLNVWVDEASTLYTTANGIAAAFGSLFTDEKQAPLYFLLLSLWRSIDHSIFFARLFSILCSLLAILVFFRLASKIWEKKNALTVTALFAFHPYLFWASLEIRLYSFVILLTCLLFKFFLDGFLNDSTETADTRKSRNIAQFFYAVIATAALYTNYYLGFPIGGGFAALLILGKWKSAKRYFMLMLAVGLAILPLFYIINLQFSDRVVSFQEEKSVAEILRIVWNHFLTFSLPTEIYAPEERTIISTIRLWIVRLSIFGMLIFFLRNKGRDLDKNVIAFGTVSAISAAFFIFVYFQLGSGYVEIRHASVYFVSIFLFVCAAVIKVTPDKFRFAAFLLVLAFYGYSLLLLYPTGVKRGDWQNVVTYISTNETPVQPVVVFPVYDKIAVTQYYRGINNIFPGEKAFSFFAEDTTGSPKMYEHQIQFLISEIPPDAIEVWLVTSDKCSVGETCLPLEKFVEANYTVIQEKDFYREKVRLLRKQQHDRLN